MSGSMEKDGARQRMSRRRFLWELWVVATAVGLGDVACRMLTDGELDPPTQDIHLWGGEEVPTVTVKPDRVDGEEVETVTPGDGLGGVEEWSDFERERAKEDFERFYTAWKERYVTAEGTKGPNQLRVRMREGWREEGGEEVFESTSESMGYGLLLAVMAKDRETFDSLYRYVQAYPVEGTSLMNWWVEPDGSLSNDGGNLGSATDGDMDIATALIFASKRWGGDYEAHAKAVIDDLMRYCVETETMVIKLGNEWGGSRITQPAFHSPGQFALFAEVSGDERWLQVAETSYQIFENIHAVSGSPLFPNACTAEGVEIEDPWDPDVEYFYGYNATRVGMRLAWATLWQQDERARNILERYSMFWENKEPKQVVDGYELDGTPGGEWPGVGSFQAPIVAASITSGNSSFRERYYTYMREIIANQQGYFSDSLMMLALGTMAGKTEEILNV